MSSILSD
jgi:hypothetical protein